MLTKALTSFTGFTIGDLIAQSLTGVSFDVWRCVRLSLYGLMVDGPMGHSFYKLVGKFSVLFIFLDINFNRQSCKKAHSRYFVERQST